MRRILIIFAAIIVATPPSTASEEESDWRLVARAESRAFVEFVDTNSLEIRDGRLTATFLKNYDQPQNDARKPYQSMKTLRMFDCAERKTGVITIIRYVDRGGRGELVDTLSRAPIAENLSPLAPDSVGEEESEFVCSMWERRSSLPSTPELQNKPAAVRLRGALS